MAWTMNLRLLTLYLQISPLLNSRLRANWCWPFFLGVPQAHHPPKVECVASFLLPHCVPPQLVSVQAHYFARTAPRSRTSTPLNSWKICPILPVSAKADGHPEPEGRPTWSFSLLPEEHVPISAITLITLFLQCYIDWLTYDSLELWLFFGITRRTFKTTNAGSHSLYKHSPPSQKLIELASGGAWALEFLKSPKWFLCPAKIKTSRRVISSWLFLCYKYQVVYKYLLNEWMNKYINPATWIESHGISNPIHHQNLSILPLRNHFYPPLHIHIEFLPFFRSSLLPMRPSHFPPHCLLVLAFPGAL